jgi:hypothetical protein
MAVSLFYRGRAQSPVAHAVYLDILRVAKRRLQLADCGFDGDDLPWRPNRVSTSVRIRIRFRCQQLIPNFRAAAFCSVHQGVEALPQSVPWVLRDPKIVFQSEKFVNLPLNYFRFGFGVAPGEEALVRIAQLARVCEVERARCQENGELRRVQWLSSKSCRAKMARLSKINQHQHGAMLGRLALSGNRAAESNEQEGLDRHSIGPPLSIRFQAQAQAKVGSKVSSTWRAKLLLKSHEVLHVLSRRICLH